MPDAVTLAAQTSSAGNFWNAYTATTIPSATVGAQFLNTSGMNGAIMFEIVENNVAGSSSVIIEGSFQNTAGLTASSALWYPLGYYVIVSAGTTGTTLTRSQGTLAISQNSRYVLQVLDAYPYMRARVTANGSSASLTVNVYAVPG
jgi:hypothetical protein